MTIRNGDTPAMPCDANDLYNATVREDMEWEKAALGITKREQFAMAAMQGILSNPYWNEHGEYTHQAVGKSAKEYADALLDELDKDGGE